MLEPRIRQPQTDLRLGRPLQLAEESGRLGSPLATGAKMVDCRCAQPMLHPKISHAGCFNLSSALRTDHDNNTDHDNKTCGDGSWVTEAGLECGWEPLAQNLHVWRRVAIYGRL